MVSCLLIKQEKLERCSYPRGGGGGEGAYNHDVFFVHRYIKAYNQQQLTVSPPPPST